MRAIEPQQDRSGRQELAPFIWERKKLKYVVLFLILAACVASAKAACRGDELSFFERRDQTLRSSTKRVFAHYFASFPRSIDNRDPPSDYYAKNYLVPGGENGKFQRMGGYLRERPLPRPSRSEKNWAELDMEDEVRSAHGAGLDGFAFDILQSQGLMWDRLVVMLDVVQRVAPDFKVLLMPDMEAEFKGHPERLLGAIRQLHAHPAIYRTGKGEIVIAPFNAQRQSLEWWRDLLSKLRSENISVAFLPLFQGWERYVDQFASISMGVSDWGTRSPIDASQYATAGTVAHKRNLIWMAPVSPQDMRPKDLVFWEARNSLNYRVMWENAISGKADWVHIISWNDYSEHTEIAPSTGIGNSFLDLTAYYVSWFKQAAQPKVICDRLYYFYRRHSTITPPDPNKQPASFRVAGGDSPSNEIELLAFLPVPGTLEIEIGDQISTVNAQAGMTSFRVPLRVGVPVFRLKRNGADVLHASGRWRIVDRIDYQDLLYRSGKVQ